MRFTPRLSDAHGCTIEMVAEVAAYVATLSLPPGLDPVYLLIQGISNAFDVVTLPCCEDGPRCYGHTYEAGALSCAKGTIDMLIDGHDRRRGQERRSGDGFSGSVVDKRQGDRRSPADGWGMGNGERE